MVRPIRFVADALCGARRLGFLGEDTLVIMKGDVSNKDFWAFDFAPGSSASSPGSDAGSSSGISPSRKTAAYCVRPDARGVGHRAVRFARPIKLLPSAFSLLPSASPSACALLPSPLTRGVFVTCYP